MSGSDVQDLHARMRSWVGEVLGAVPVSLEAPGGAVPQARSVGLFPWELRSSTTTSGGKAPALQFSVRYLVTAWAPDAALMHHDLCELAFAAMSTPEFELDLEPVPAALWSAFGTSPRLAFSIRVPLRRERVRPPVSVVRSPPVIVSTTMNSRGPAGAPAK